MKTSFENDYLKNRYNILSPTAKPGQLFHYPEILAFIQQQFGNCPEEIFSDQIHDFISQVEQEICSRSKLFMYSPGSSWSKIVRIERSIGGIDGGDLNIEDFVEEPRDDDAIYDYDD